MLQGNHCRERDALALAALRNHHHVRGLCLEASAKAGNTSEPSPRHQVNG